MAKPRSYRSHGDVPAYWRWRDGRPSWIPSEGLRGHGWKRIDLKDPAGAYLSRGSSIDRAEAINAAVADWREGRAVPGWLAPFAPEGAGSERPRAAVAVSPLSIGRLLTDWQASPEFAALAASTQRDYRGKAKRLIDTLSGYASLPGPDATDAELAAYELAVAETRAEDIFSLEPDEDPNGEAAIQDPLYEAYWALMATGGKHMASGVMAVAGVFLGWVRARRTRRVHNWAGEVERQTPPGRIRVVTWAELDALIWAAETLGLPSLADSFILGVDLSWSQADRLALTWNRVQLGDDGILRAATKSQLTEGPNAGRVGRQKTGRVGATTFLSIGRQRVSVIQARQAAMAAKPTHVLWCERTGRPWLADHYRHVIAEEVRPLAATKVASCAEVRDQDLRDTAITLCRAAGLTIEETCGRTLQSRRRVLDLWDQAYGEIGQEIVDAGAAKMDAYLQARGVGL